jgi:parallel beta-helix repeat protein
MHRILGALIVLTSLAARPAAAVTSITTSGPFTLSKPGETYILKTNLIFPSDGLKITANNVTLDLAGNIIYGSPPSVDQQLPPTVGIRVQNVSRVTIRGGLVTNFNYNVYLQNATACTLQSVDASMGLPVNAGYGIYLTISAGNLIRACTVNFGDLAGIQLSNSNGNTLQSNTTSSCKVSGIGLYQSHNNTLQANRIDHSQFDGMAIDHSNSNTFLNNNAVDNGEYGIVFTTGSGNILFGNLATGNRTGIELTNIAANDVLQGNFCLNNRLYGIFVEASIGNRIQANIAKGNGSYDLYDADRACGSNIWAFNRFAKAYPSCVH